MKKINNEFKLSKTDIKRIEAHTRALARNEDFDGYVEAWFSRETGTIKYIELLLNSYISTEGENWDCISSVRCYADN